MIAALLEAPFALIAGRVALRRLLAGGLAALSLALAVCAAVKDAWALSLALSLAGAASGVACSAAQLAVVSSDPGRASSAMSRWIAYAAAGDVLCPLLVALVLWLGGDQRAALAAIALLVALQAWSSARAAPAGRDEHAAADDEPLALRPALSLALRAPRLWLYLFAASACGLLDEVVIALVALRLHDDLAWPQTWAAAAVIGVSLGDLVGALITERLLERVTPRRLLICSALVSAGALGLFVVARSPLAIAVALGVLGIAGAAHYPLVKAAAFSQMRRRPGVVEAMGVLFVPFDIALPLVVGVIATRYGLGAGLMALCAQPLVVIAAAWSMPRKAVAPEREDALIDAHD